MAQFTKQKLAETLKSLMIQKSLDKITVKELVDACGVNRQTFYYHFEDIYDLMGWIYRTEAVDPISDISYATWHEGYRSIFDYIDQNREFCASTYRSLDKAHLDRLMDNVMREVVTKVFESSGNISALSEEEKTTIVQLYAHSLSGAILEWVAAGFEPAPDVVASQVFRAFDGTLPLMVARLCDNREEQAE